MKQNLNNLTKNEKKFLIALLDGSRTDAEIVKKTKLSKATCSRIRKKLEKDVIEEYIPIIELDRFGVEVFLVMMFKWNSFDKTELTKKVFDELEKNPHVIFLANGEGTNASTVMFMGFENISKYTEYFKEFRKQYDKHISNVNTLLLPSKEIIKQDFTEIIKHILKMEG